MPARLRFDGVRDAAVHLAGELARTMGGDDGGLAMRIDVEDLDRTVHDQEEVNAALAPFKHQHATVQRFLRTVA